MVHSRVHPSAQVAKLVDALALGASEATHGGSSPLLGTNKTAKAVFVVTRKQAIKYCLREDLKLSKYAFLPYGKGVYI
jgi:hypothetical protein